MGWPRRTWQTAKKAVNLGSNLQFLWTIGGGAVLSALLTALLRAVADFPAPLLVLFALGMFMLAVAGTRTALGRLGVLPRVGESPGTGPPPGGGQEGWIRPEELGNYLDSINRTMEEKGFGRSLSLPPPAESKEATPSWEELNRAREKRYEETRGLFLVHEWVPSSEPGQKADVTIRLFQHKIGPLTAGKIKAVEYTLGPKFTNHSLVRTNPEGGFSAEVAMWGPMLCLAKIYFTDGSQPLLLERYINFASEDQPGHGHREGPQVRVAHERFASKFHVNRERILFELEALEDTSLSSHACIVTGPDGNPSHAQEDVPARLRLGGHVWFEYPRQFEGAPPVAVSGKYEVLWRDPLGTGSVDLARRTFNIAVPGFSVLLAPENLRQTEPVSLIVSNYEATRQFMARVETVHGATPDQSSRWPIRWSEWRQERRDILRGDSHRLELVEWIPGDFSRGVSPKLRFLLPGGTREATLDLLPPEMESFQHHEVVVLVTVMSIEPQRAIQRNVRIRFFPYGLKGEIEEA